jgi:hypothetical protein
MRTTLGFQPDQRSREELERDGYALLERTSAYHSKSDHTPVWIELYMKGSDMVIRLLETPDLYKTMNDLGGQHGRA